ncbi:hypothetical protein ACHAWO_000341 [Cyclotella atomus]|uniref:tRNA/rRNA methyltransferase SpoU type domain-containing protein n=1 Tax=Cyclotella atomus TaxID=382360 RepID=A0ABD3MTB5_9STRA
MSSLPLHLRVLQQPRLSQHPVNEEDVREKTRSASDPDYAGGSYGNQSAEGMEKRRARLHAELTKLGINPDEIQSNPDQFGTSTLRTYNSFIFPKSAGALAVAESPTRAKVVANSMSFLIREYKADRERWIRNVDQQRNTTSNNSVKHSITVILDNVRSAPNVGNILRLGEAAQVESVRLCAMGAAELVSLGEDEHQMSTLQTVLALKARGVKVYGVETTANSTTIWDTAIPDKDVAFVFGNELIGVAIGGNGQGSQLNSYLLASLVATYLNKALVILEPPRDFNRFSQGSQFGCPTNPYKEYGTTTRFPDGLQRMIQHPHFISRGCRVPCQGTMTYKDWEIKRQSQLQYLKKGELHHEECKEASRHIKVMPMGGYDLRELFHRSLRSQMVDRSSSNYDPKQAHSWAMRLGAKPHEAEVFTTLSNASEIWDFLSALMSRSGLLRFQPWIARDVAEYIRSSNLPTDVSYDAIHVRRGDKLIREATKEVNNYWLERGYRQPFPTNYIPFAHYIERGWGGRHGNYCKRIKLRGTVNNKLSARLVYIATDDPATVRKEIDELPKAKGGNTIADNCYRLRFIFSPAAQEDGTVYHLNSKGFHDDCRDRYLRNVQVSKNSSISSHTLDSSWD